MLHARIKIAGVRQSVVADACGVSGGTVSKWFSGKIVIPADRLADVSRITGIPAAELRPDLAALFTPTHPAAEVVA